jgi:amino acid adenylation domain-containing protein
LRPPGFQAVSERLYRYLDDAAARWPDNQAVREPGGGSATYSELQALSNRLRDRLIALGVRRGDRVGFWITKSIDAVATIFGVLKAGAAYVPVDPTAPAARNGFILSNCAVSVVVVENRFRIALEAEMGQQGWRPQFFEIESSGDGRFLRAALDSADRLDPAPVAETVAVEGDDLAYILYTSGSTGKPKGVMLSHRNAVSFVDWCAEVFCPTSADRFSSHAPFHFDLSILDLYTPLTAGAALMLVAEDTGKKPMELAQFIEDQRITVWYSAPSILSLMAQFGKLETRNVSLRLVLFAGEVFPVTHLRSLTERWPHPKYFNLYGPTETNVCTFYEVPTPIPADRVEPMPIGHVCKHLEGVVVDPGGGTVAAGAEGELCIRGAGVTQGYWNLPEQSSQAFLAVGSLPPYYRTGDIVSQLPDGSYRFVGRRDRMIKKRGFRVELGEIEACLYQHPGVLEAAVVAAPDDELGMKVHAHLACRDGGRLSLVDLKSFCSKHVPVYMIPDVFTFHPALPKTSTDKVDYQALKVKG